MNFIRKTYFRGKTGFQKYWNFYFYLPCIVAQTSLYFPGWTFYCPGWTFYCPGWTFYCPGWTFYCPGWTFYCPGWTFYCPGWTLYCHGWTSFSQGCLPSLSTIYEKSFGLVVSSIVRIIRNITRAAVVHFNFRAGSTILVPVCTVSPGHWVNKEDT